MISFPTEYQQILDRISGIDPEKYGKTRNFIDGAVSYLSPYISRGVISTRQVMDHVLELDLPFYKIEKFIQELAWRDYWQQIWIEKGNLIDYDLKHEQEEVYNYEMPEAITNGTTRIDAIDQAIQAFYEHGYLHNHVRMYLGSITCNIGKSHWKVPAQWMYYHLLDGDWASNALSWQWVAGSNSNKKYYANQDNINKYCKTRQGNTFMDVDYSEIASIPTPHELEKTHLPELHTQLPEVDAIEIDTSLPVLIYNYYNMDPKWRSEMDANRILLLEPSVFDKYPISSNSMQFLLGLSENIPNIKTYVGEFIDLKKEYNPNQIFFKEHPLNKYEGVEDKRDWMFGVKGYYSSFFGFWKRCMKELN